MISEPTATGAEPGKSSPSQGGCTNDLGIRCAFPRIGMVSGPGGRRLSRHPKRRILNTRKRKQRAGINRKEAAMGESMLDASEIGRFVRLEKPLYRLWLDY